MLGELMVDLQYYSDKPLNTYLYRINVQFKSNILANSRNDFCLQHKGLKDMFCLLLTKFIPCLTQCQIYSKVLLV